ncbi:hypothetical protein [Ornithinimicrobium sufpigmenti]|uniref:hypothetical protein n=1 Tax=Ornithinimicrobium sufpigmenti TaxID=2508882 RepID=UPI00103681CE|nr:MULTISPECIES: hypothetical protein [unclassified Ornithinimicrobium]
MSLSPRRSRSRPSRAARPAGLSVLPLVLPLVLALGACAGDDGGTDATAAVTPGALAGSTTNPSPTPTPSQPTDVDASARPTTATGQAETGQAGTGQAGTGEVVTDSPEDEEPEVWATFTAEPGQAPGDVSEAFSDDPRLQAVLRFNAEFARAVTDDDPRRAEWLATLDPESYEALMDYLGEEFGKDYPGPLPFTPLDVGPGDEDGTASVQGCIISAGFALGDEGFTDATVTSIEYALVEDPAEPDAWLVQAMWAGAYDCSTTDVPARLW